MTTTVDANNSSGFKVTADTSGILQLQTNGTAALTVDTSQNVGIGTSSPSTKLTVVSSTNAGIAVNDGTVNTILYNTTSTNGSLGTTTNHPMAFYTNNSEKMRILSTGSILSLSGGSTTATGTGIAFPAAQSASSDVNTLDDYEEGSFTPTLGGTSTYAQQAGSYKKVGGLVYVSGILQVTTLGTGSASQMSGFPFTCSVGPRNTLAVAYWSSTVGSLAYLAFYVPAGSATSNTIATTAVANTVQDGYGVFQNGTYVIFSGCYHAS